MRHETKLVILCGALWLLTKTVLLYTAPMESGVIAGTLLNLFFIMLVSLYTIHRNVKKGSAESFIEDLRAVLRSTMKYALLATVLFGVFMFGVAADVNAEHRQRVESEIESHFSTDEAYAKFIEENPNLTGTPREEALEKALSSFRMYSSWYVQTTLALLGLVVFSVFASIITTVFWRNLMLRP
jgi:hypothetical protein